VLKHGLFLQQTSCIHEMFLKQHRSYKRYFSTADTVLIRVVSKTDTMQIREVFTTYVKDIQDLSTPGIVQRTTQEFSTMCIVHMFLHLILCIYEYDMFLQKTPSIFYMFLQHISAIDTMHI
jgi:hypothetical protein